MPLEITTDPREVRLLCDAIVETDPVGGTIFATIADWAQRDGAAVWAAHPAGQPTVLVARSHVDTPVTFTPGWNDGWRELAASALRSLVPPAVSIAGPTDIIDEIAVLLTRSVAERVNERLYRLDELVEPMDVAGHARLAAADDVGYLAEWYVDFQLEALGRVAPGQGSVEMVRKGIATGRCWLWLDGADEPRAFAQRRPVAGGVSRIGPVYTPRPHRGHGYGSAATAAAARDILREGAVPCLFTDLANPTSNHIYQRLGFRPVMDRAMLRFD